MKSRYIGPALCALLALVPASPAAALAGEPTKPAPVSEAELRESIAILASDDFGGRKPGTEGETKTISYIADAFYRAGLEGGVEADAGWFSPVALVEAAPVSSVFSLTASEGDEIAILGKSQLSQPDGIVFYSRAPETAATFDGIVRLAPGEMPAGDLAGKLVVLTASDDIAAAMGRIEKIAESKPAAVLVAVSDQAAFDRVTRGLGRQRTVLASKVDDAPAGVTGFATPAALQAILDAAGVAEAGALASASGTIATRNAEREYTSQNVVARLPGTDAQAGAVVFMGHWDHVGTCRPEGAEDRICNGAVDNASGIAVLIAVARRLAKMERFERDIYFVATTAEEIGLLGAYAMAENPPVPLDSIVVALNVDTIAIAGRDAKVAIIGRGKTDLDADVDRIARDLGRSIDSSDEANSFIRRQDGWALAQKGVPALMVGGSFSDMPLLEAFLSSDYHGPDDELTDATPLGGAAEDADLHVALGAYFADADAYQPTAKE